ncbi:MAG: hypothetical protein ACOYX1_17040 [Acidobacteriota bacterium]
MNPALAERAAQWRHRLTLAVLVCGAAGLAAWLGWRGYDYYRLPLNERPFHPLHPELRPSGGTGIRLGLLSASLFLCIYLYPLRKRIAWLQRIGKTRRWLDVHVALGLIVPLIVTVHASFKVHGLIGMAYWIMLAIVASGVAGRYLYAQIPRSVSAAELSLKELAGQAEAWSQRLHEQRIFSAGELAAALAAPSREAVESMPMLGALAHMVALDLKRPFRVAALRRRVIDRRERLSTLWGLRRSRHQELESVLEAVRAGAWLAAKIAFLRRAGEIFHLWHVVHKPFSYSFAVIVAAHIALVFLMGYF